MTTMMMMMVAATITFGGTTKMPDRVGDKFEPPLEREKAEFGPSGVLASPPLGSVLARGGGVRMPTTGPDDHHNPNGEKLKRA